VNGTITDLGTFEDGRIRLDPEIHPFPFLLSMDAEAVLEGFRLSQRADFSQVVREVDRAESNLKRLFADLRDRTEEGNPFRATALFRPGALEEMFLDLHDHVMAHPVWRHPFFVRVFNGDADRPQIHRFLVHYFNQVKNTRQCVALAVGRFNGLMDLPYGPVNERVSEITQIALAQLVSDEYGVGMHRLDDYPDLGKLLRSHTHIAMFRQLLDGLGIAPDDQDVPMLPEVADNVLTQRLIAGHPAFTPLEALAATGLGMEWGVPEFFSLLLGGLIRFAVRDGIPLGRHELQVFIEHVRYDVLHAVSVMLVTSLHMRGSDDLATVKGACNALMASRFAMMSGIYRAVFGESSPGLDEIGLEARYRLRDRRIASALIEARRAVGAGIDDVEAYRDRIGTPFLFM
jgi:pyrroloquinoline quinone (PQQ) biosynthesis protein C